MDDLVVNERPNNHYVKKDDEQTPDLIKCLAALKMGEGKPGGISEEIWLRASRDMEMADSREKDKHYRIVTDAEGKQNVIQLEQTLHGLQHSGGQEDLHNVAEKVGHALHALHLTAHEHHTQHEG